MLERVGFKYFTIIIAILFVVFIALTCANIREKSTVDMQTATIGQMFSALVGNDQTMAVVVAIVLINSAMYITSNLVIYFFKYDFGGSGWYNSYTLFTTFGGAVQILAMMLFYPLLSKFVTSLRIFFICLAMEMLGYAVLLLLSFTNMSNVFLLFIPGFLIFAAAGMLNVLTTVFLANTVDYGQLKTGRRDESVVFSMQTFVVKLASGFAALVASIALSVFALSSEATTEAQQSVDFSAGVSLASKAGLRMTMTILPIIGLVAAFFWFRQKYILTDEKLAEIEETLREG